MNINDNFLNYGFKLAGKIFYHSGGLLAGRYFLTPLKTFLHENGHALAARIFYKNAFPEIFYFNDGSALTKYNASSLSLIGRICGKNRSDGFVALRPLE